MQLYCPRCIVAFTGKRDCPNCGVRLISPSEAHVLPAERVSVDTEQANVSVASRVLAGGFAAVGVSMGCRELISGSLPFFGENDTWLASDFAFVLLLMIRSFAGLLAGVLAGAGHVKSPVAGLMAGCAGAAVLMAIQMFEPGSKMTFGASVLAVFTVGMATFSGWISGKIWPSQATLPKATFESKGSSLLDRAKELQQREEAKKIRPTQWIRITIAVSLTICGFVGAEGIRNFLAKKSDGLVDMGGARNVPVLCLQISAIAMLLGGVASGASTGAGFRHGVFAGLIAGAMVAGLYGLRGPEKLKSVAGLIEVLDWPGDKVPPIRVGSALFGGCFVILSAGGLFGGMLFPPIANRQKVGRDTDIGRPVGQFG